MTGHRAAKAGKRFLLFALLWLIISEGRTDLLAVGLAAALATTAMTFAIWADVGRRPNLLAILAFFPGFVWRSIQGGIDVAWRVAQPRMPVRPGFTEVHLRDGDRGTQVLLCDVLSLMPGTLAAGLHCDDAVVHMLVDHDPVRRMIDAEEDRIMHLFLPDPATPDPAAPGAAPGPEGDDRG